MKPHLPNAIFIVCVVAGAVALVLVSVSTDDQKAAARLTYDDNDKYFLNEWKDAGGGDMSTSGFPESVLAQFNITEKTLAPEIFFSKEFQSALFDSRERFYVADDLDGYLSKFRGSLDGESGTSFSIENEMRKFAAISRLPSPDDLPPDVLEALTFNQEQFARLSSRRSGTLNGMQTPTPNTTASFDEPFNRLIPTDQHRLERYGERSVDVLPILNHAQEISDPERHEAFQSLFQIQEHGAGSLVGPRVSVTTSRREFIPVSRLARNTLVPTVSVKHKIERSLDRSLSSLFSNVIDGVVVHPLNSADARTLTRDLSPVPRAFIRPDSENFLVRESRNKSWWRYYSRTEIAGAIMVAEGDLIDAPLHNANLVIAGKDARISYLIDEENNWTTFIAALSDSALFRCAADGRLVGVQKEVLIDFCSQILKASR